ncbi:DUF1570 domain-containing protein [Stratiformator vulcanicus]|nr:DUF1570 domain-containing protein [Stratiformator vulcanicus]
MPNQSRPRWSILTLWVAFCFSLSATTALAKEPRPLTEVVFKAGGKEIAESGRVIVEAADGGILLEAVDGQLWNVTPKAMVSRTHLDQPFQPISADDFAGKLQEEFGEEFSVSKTKHYVIASSAAPEFTDWCETTLERFLNVFTRYWDRDPLELHEPEFPLAAIIFSDQAAFAQYARADIGDAAATTIGYYSIRSNRIVFSDLSARFRGRQVKSRAEMNRLLSASSANVATVIHEATHQIAFNCGVHIRYADNPMWMTEGFAMFCETPDLRSTSGWRTIGDVNRARLPALRGASLDIDRLISSDDPLRDASTARTAYAESWALTYFLAKARRGKYREYLEAIGSKPRLIWDDAETRRAEFEAHFGDVDELQDAFRRYLSRLR